MLVPAPINSPTVSTDRPINPNPVLTAPPPTSAVTKTAPAPPDPVEAPGKMSVDLPPKDIDEAPAEPIDLIATLEAPRPKDVEPIDASGDGPFGPPPAFDQSPLQAQRANFPNPPPEQPTNAYSALQRLETPFDTATFDIAR